jgi:hypothetical protein
LEELIEERQDGLEKLTSAFRAFEEELANHEIAFRRAFTREPPPMPMNPVCDRRLKRESSLKKVSSAKKIPPLTTPAATAVQSAVYITLRNGSP